MATRGDNTPTQPSKWHKHEVSQIHLVFIPRGSDFAILVLEQGDLAMSTNKRNTRILEEAEVNVRQKHAHSLDALLVSLDKIESTSLEA